jgi:hypothetical protein
VVAGDGQVGEEVLSARQRVDPREHARDGGLVDAEAGIVIAEMLPASSRIW